MHRYTPFMSRATARSCAPDYPEDCCHTCGADKMFFSESLPSATLQVHRCIGKGAFGSVYEGLYYNGRVAVKQLKRDIRQLGQRHVPFTKNDVKRMEKEARILRNLKHPNILHVYAFTYNPPQIITEFCMNGSLRSNLNRKTQLVNGWKRKLKLLKGMAAGMRYLHERDVPICHRDLKSENILIGCDGEAIICDVGLSIYVTDEDLSRVEAEFSGTLNFTWQPPEVALYKRYSEKSDVYSVGIIMWELMTEQLPFGVGTTMSHLTGFQFHQQLKDRVVSGERPEIPDELHGDKKDIPVGYIQLMQQCWSQNPEDRPTFAEFDTLISLMWKACDEEAGLKLLQQEPLPLHMTQATKGRKRPRKDVFSWSSKLLALSGVAAVFGGETALSCWIPWVKLTLHDVLQYSTAGLGLMILFGSFLNTGFNLIKDLSSKPGTAVGDLKWSLDMERPVPSSPFKDFCPTSLLRLSKELASSRFCTPFLQTSQTIRTMFFDGVEERSEKHGDCHAVMSEIKSFCDEHEELPTEEEWKELRKKLNAYVDAVSEQRRQSNGESFSLFEDVIGGASAL